MYIWKINIFVAIQICWKWMISKLQLTALHELMYNLHILHHLVGCENTMYPLTFHYSIHSYSSQLTWAGKFLFGVAAIPVMKSLVINVLITIDLWHEGLFLTGSLSKWTGMMMTGIWLRLDVVFVECNTSVAGKSACLSVLSTPLVR